MKKHILMIPLASVIVPLICIAISIVLSPWFSITNNALSDLGHSIDSNVSPIFNFGLSLGGSLIIVTSVVMIVRFSKALSISMSIAGYLLILIAVFDEVYNRYERLHFWVSTAFFISLAVSLVIYSLTTPNKIKKMLALILIGVGVVVWFLHLFYGVPRGAAIPELISLSIAIPFYLEAVLKSIKTV